jgi:hypothetical protein
LPKCFIKPKQTIAQAIVCHSRESGNRVLNLAFRHRLLSHLHLYVKQVFRYKIKSPIPACAGMTKVFLQKLLFWFWQFQRDTPPRRLRRHPSKGGENRADGPSRFAGAI